MSQPSTPLRILVVDDTITYRKLISDACAKLEQTEVVATASRGNIALQKLRQFPVDLVLLDVVMPEMDGIETLKHIREEFPHIAVVMISGDTKREAPTTVKALKMGAVEFINKPQEKSVEEAANVLSKELRRIMVMTRNWKLSHPGNEAAPPIRHQEKPAKPTPSQPRKTPAASRTPRFSSYEMVAIGVSTGGPKALSQVIPKLPGTLSKPVLIVQHMPAVFTKSLAEHLNRESALNVSEAQAGDVLEAGKVYIAPGGRHMILKRNQDGQLTVALNDDPPIHSCRPAVDVLFRSIADIVDRPVLAAILTGMGSDGADGVAALKERSCYCLAQDEETSVVFGMPQAVVSRELADEIIPLDQMAERISLLITSPLAR